MTVFNPSLGREPYALIRFGLGYPARGAPVTAQGLLDRVTGPDHVAQKHPAHSFAQSVEAFLRLRDAKINRKSMMDGDGIVKTLRSELQQDFLNSFRTDLARAIDTSDPFRERLQYFWSNHFAVRPIGVDFRSGRSGYFEEAIRQNMTGSFADMLKAAVTHPIMMMYLDQVVSIGPNSPVGQSSKRGLNENLAREVLELHTLGVGAAYTQTDVTEFAELLTGLQFSHKKGFSFNARRAEPGAETVLGRSYGSDAAAKLDDIHAVLDDLARHPATARFISTKLARYFVADDPDPDLINTMTDAFAASNGWLPDVYAAMLDHPASWSGLGAKVKWPFDYMASILRATLPNGDAIVNLPNGKLKKQLMRRLQWMGQDYADVPGPDGWPDTATAWIQPHGLAARINWAMGHARNIPGETPDPDAFLFDVLGDAAGDRLRWAAHVAESRVEGVGIILASAEFNRR